MKKIYIVQDEQGKTPILDFISSLEPKARKKLEYGFYCLATQPNYLTPPNVKHFTLEKYQDLYEYRARIKILLRVVFTLDKDRNIILLCPLIKRHDRDTMQALEKSLKLFHELQPERLLEYVPIDRGQQIDMATQ